MKNHVILKSFRILAASLLAAGCLFSVGCATSSDPENAGTRPWNSPRGWESGLPVSLTEGR